MTEKIRLISAFVVCVFCGAVLVAAAAPEFRWGGPGYDPVLTDQGNSSRFSARPHSRNPSLVEILVDAEATVGNAAAIELVPRRGAVLISGTCWKAMRHQTSPWACPVAAQDLAGLRGTGQIRVKDTNGRLVLKDAVDFDAIHRALGETR